MFASRRILLSSAVLALTLSLPGRADAVGWTLPAGTGEVLLPYAAAYPAGTHRGIDLGACGGDAVRAPSAGIVAFAGSVPADGGGSCIAISIELPDGLRVSLLPLAAVDVATGDSVAPGDVLGVLRANGDDSSSATHLHLGVRRGNAYLDPGAWLPSGVESTANITDPAAAVVTAGAQSQAPGGGAVGIASTRYADCGLAVTGGADQAEAGARIASGAKVTTRAQPDVPGASSATSAEFGMAPLRFPVTSRTAAIGPVRDAAEGSGIPAASQLAPMVSAGHGTTTIPGVGSSPRTVTGTVLILGMLGVVASIVLQRRAAVAGAH